MSKQTAIEWLEESLEHILTHEQQMQVIGLFQQAKEIEKEQITDAWLSAWKDSMINPLENKYYQPEAEQYYNETFKN